MRILCLLLLTLVVSCAYTYDPPSKDKNSVEIITKREKEVIKTIDNVYTVVKDESTSRYHFFVLDTELGKLKEIYSCRWKFFEYRWVKPKPKSEQRRRRR